jgi:vesicle coat complex subunit
MSVEFVRNEALKDHVLKKMVPPLVTLLSSSPSETKYATLRIARLLVHKYTFLFQNELKVFFCAYDDPIYIKVEKLEMLVALTNDSNVHDILAEFKE